MIPSNERTHEPNLRELTAELDGLRKLVEAKFEALGQKMDERDKRYADRFTAMDEKTWLALTSSKEAVAKAETATEKRFDAVNEFRGTLSDQAANLLPRAEATARFEAMDSRLSVVKDELIRVGGIAHGAQAVKSEGRANLGAIATGIGIIVSLLALFGLELARVMK